VQPVTTWLPVTPRKTAEIVLEYRIEQCNQLQRKGRQQAKVKWLCIDYMYKMGFELDAVASIGLHFVKSGMVNLLHKIVAT
jgi:hypothetical protein